jgi:anti-sigma B factor antagonist
MGLQVYARELGSIVVIEAAGKLTLTDGHTKLRDEIHVASANERKKFILNLARVEFIDSYGIGELVRCYSVVRRAGGDLKLACLNEKVLHVLEISHLAAIFDICPNESVALQAFGQYS